ncbi:hypothetical protein [Ornithinimicrobium pekingense]|uniref:Uncharacterized protein n=1 Tax=Ornithinimicrobium pekingense TaxID=384677 RepID=A0ABQ2F975_9MICO|nr:hypothetical protein [Ornithinimicrobium pekingense]GGK73905.1 hypothetical protein GCM10011509_23210 [Ornithinimicrobium pekingense]
MNAEPPSANHDQRTVVICNDFALERYKHVLAEQSSLDANTHTSFTLFQGILTATVAAVSLVVLQAEAWSLTTEASMAVLKTAALLTALTGAAFVASMVGNMFSWIDLRREEQRITLRFANDMGRDDPSFGNIWRWKEFYLTIMVAVWTAAAAWLLLGPYMNLVAST